MATAIRVPDVASAFPEGFTWPSRDVIEDGLRQARRLATEARNTAEDLAADATLRVRRHPFAAVAAAAGAGIVVGAAIGCLASFWAAKTHPCGG